VPQLTANGHQVRCVRRPVQAALARDLIDLVVGPDLLRLRECPDPQCAMLFVDTSRGGQRRWCSMSRCGNRAKARAHATRTRRPDTL